MASRHLAIDIGASSGRAIVGELDETGRLRLTEVHRFENGLVQRAGHLCWDIAKSSHMPGVRSQAAAGTAR